MNMNLEYISEFFERPFEKYKKLLLQIQQKMQADDDDDDDSTGLIFGMSSAPVLKTNVANTNMHFKTEIAFSHVKEHELVEASCEHGRLALGSANIELDLRVRLMKTACN